MLYLLLAHTEGCMVCCNGSGSLLGGVFLSQGLGGLQDSRRLDSGQHHLCNAGSMTPHESLSLCNAVLLHILWPGENGDFDSSQMMLVSKKSQKILAIL